MKKSKIESKPTIKNIVACGRFSKEIDIRKAYDVINFPRKDYEPETYPALLVKVNINNNLKHITIYRNGKYIITGVNSEKELKQTYSTIVKILKKHKFL